MQHLLFIVLRTRCSYHTIIMYSDICAMCVAGVDDASRVRDLEQQCIGLQQQVHEMEVCGWSHFH